MHNRHRSSNSKLFLIMRNVNVWQEKQLLLLSNSSKMQVVLKPNALNASEWKEKKWNVFSVKMLKMKDSRMKS